jgi:predicted PurR-regulated permease PerM
MKPSNKQILSWLALSGLTMLTFIILTPFIIPLAWAGIISYASWPIAESIRRGCQGRNTLAAAMATMLVAITIFIPLIWLAWIAQKEITQIYPVLKTFLEQPYQTPDLLIKQPWLNNMLGDWLAQLAQKASDIDGISNIIKPWLSTNISNIANVAGGIGRNFIKLIFVITILFFFYRDGPNIIKALRQLLAKFLGQQSNHYLQVAGSTTRAVVYGILLTALIQGLVAGLGYWAADLPSPVIFGAITAVLALIPFCTPLAWGAAGLWLLLQGQTSQAIGICLWGALVISQLDNVLRPIFISNVSRIPFLLILFGVIGGLLAFGLVGLFIGPIVLTVTWSVWKEWSAQL